jgi:hypothetical protein
MADQEQKDICKEPSNLEKWILACILGFVFLIVASPYAFKFADKFLSMVGFGTMRGDSPTGGGWVLHMVIFILLVRLLMK